ncbi:MAG: hypothetical protein LBI06_01710, partial [Treponema sp.]|nr:hypothetical protein [Treponema sp.]
APAGNSKGVRYPAAPQQRRAYIGKWGKLNHPVNVKLGPLCDKGPCGAGSGAAKNFWGSLP